MLDVSKHMLLAQSNEVACLDIVTEKVAMLIYKGINDLAN